MIEELSASGLAAKLSKCKVGRRKIEYLGHIIGGEELAVPEHQAAAMTKKLAPSVVELTEEGLQAGRDIMVSLVYFLCFNYSLGRGCISVL